MGARAAGPVHVMEVEHEHHKADLLEIRALTADLVPGGRMHHVARALSGPAAVRAGLMEHIHLENNVLFRRALAE
jgi:regulator of cell morphogenesis and NO signaling